MSRTDEKKAPKARETSKASEQETHVPREAEDFEHTLRRLTIEKQKQRDKSFGLYM